MENQQLETIPDQSAFSMQGFEHAQRVAKMLATSSLIPKEYQGNIQNTMIAMEMANRIGASPLMVMQNLYIVHGKPSWSSTFIIAALNSCKRFSPLRFEVSGDGETLECFAWAYEVDTKEKITGPVVSMKMAKAGGWVDKNGSKWKTMPQVMIRYRAAAFFGRLYAPEIMMGMQTAEEIVDVEAQAIPQIPSVDELEALLVDAMPELTKTEVDSARRILDGKETASYNKLFKTLTEKIQTQPA